MSGRRRHRRSDEIKNNQVNNPGLLGNLDFSALAGLINRIDVNEISSFVNNFANNANAAKTYDAGNEQEEDNEQVDMNSFRRNEIVSAIQTLINCDKAELVQVIIQLYATSRVTKR